MGDIVRIHRPTRVRSKQLFQFTPANYVVVAVKGNNVQVLDLASAKGQAGTRDLAIMNRKKVKPASRPPGFFLGAVVSKVFRNVAFQGVVSKVSEDGGVTFFQVTFHDGDQEEVYIDELVNILVHHPQLRGHSPFTGATPFVQGSFVLCSRDKELVLAKVEEFRPNDCLPLSVAVWAPIRRSRAWPDRSFHAVEPPDVLALAPGEVSLRDLELQPDGRFRTESRQAVQAYVQALPSDR
jgi:hypothetical protein